MIARTVVLPLSASKKAWRFAEDRRASAPDNTGPYDPESVKSWEAGAKFTMFDNRFQLNLAAFTVKYDDKQEDIVKPGEDGQATLTVVENAWITSRQIRRIKRPVNRSMKRCLAGRKALMVRAHGPICRQMR